MPRFKVRVNRVEYQCADVEVEADNDAWVTIRKALDNTLTVDDFALVDANEHVESITLIEEGPLFVVGCIDDAAAFWSKDEGWCDRREATLFTAQEREAQELPTFGKWVPVEPEKQP